MRIYAIEEVGFGVFLSFPWFFHDMICMRDTVSYGT
jgi:hypothetical protein